MKHVFTNFLDRLLAVYGEPKSDNPEGFAKEYARILEDFEPDELSLAADRLLQTFKFGHWPKITDCVEACEKARRDIGIQRAGAAPMASIPGTGWRLSESGKKWFQIERGTPEFTAWMRFYRDNGKEPFARFATKHGRTWVIGSSVADFGPSMLAYIDGIYEKIAARREAE